MKIGLLIISLMAMSFISCNQGNEKASDTAAADAETKTFADDTVSAAPVVPERKSATEVQSADSIHTPEHAINWAGTYSGTLPCADCQGIQAELVLNMDKTYKLKQTFLGKNANPVLTEGSFQWLNGTNIRLNGNGQEVKDFLVAEGQLYHLDQKGRIIKGKLAKQYILKKS